MPASPTVCYDLTHLLARSGIPTPSGIDKVDLAYARHFVPRALGPSIHYGYSRPRLLSAERSREIVAFAEQSHWEGPDAARDERFARLYSELTATAQPQASEASAPAHVAIPRKSVRLHRLRHSLASDARRVPQGALYLNVAQFLFETDRFFRWIKGRPDVTPVLMVHDLLPLDYAEYFRGGYKHRFERRVATMLGYGRAFIVASEAVRARLSREMSSRGHPPAPMHVQPLPSTLGERAIGSLVDQRLAAQGYFVALGTIEPRKNHLLLLNLWRQLALEARGAAGAGARVPKLVIVGGRGWENEQIVDVLDRGGSTRPHVLEASGLSTAGLAKLLANARALLMPAFDEGYGLPLVEALALGVPVVTTDKPVFREVTQGCAHYLSPIDGWGWREAIEALSDSQSEMQQSLRAAAQRFTPPTWERYFAGIEGFLGDVAAMAQR